MLRNCKLISCGIIITRGLVGTAGVDTEFQKKEEVGWGPGNC